MKKAEDVLNESEQFKFDLTEWLLKADIPIHKLSHPATKQFLTKYTQQSVPDESTIRKNYVDRVYQNQIDKIKSAIGDEEIYLIIDETTDVAQRYVCNVMVGILNGKPSKPMLVMSEELEKTNQFTIAQTVHKTLNLIWSNDATKFGKFRLLVTDAAAYMLAAGRALKQTFEHLKHVTCLAHALNLVCEKVRENNPLVDCLSTNIKLIFSKCTRRRRDFRDLTGLQRPPKVVTTRWGTWLKAASYFNQHYDAIKMYVDQLGEEESQPCFKVKKLFSGERCNLKKELLSATKFDFLVSAITELQDPNLTSERQIEIIVHVDSQLQGNLKEKLRQLLQKNPDFKDFNCLSQSQTTLTNQRYAPLTSVAVERSFSQHKAILRPNRESLLFENLSKYAVVHCNSFL